MEWTVAIGIDAHKCVHTAVALDRLGRELERRELPASAHGYRRLWQWASALGEPTFAIEGSGCYDAGLAAFLEAAGADVYECERPTRRERRRGKSDALDAAAAARKLIAGGNGLARLRGGGRREALRVLLVERASADSARTDALNQLHALVVTAPDDLRARLGSLGENTLARAASQLRSRPGAPERTRILSEVLRRLGRRVLTLSEQLRANERELARLIASIDPALLGETGVGPLCAAQLVVSSGTPGRMRSEASFAALAGVSPLDASSGLQRRHRLNRGGDRQLNRALHVIALSRKQHHPPTAAYYARLRAGGKTKREALRCVKRTLARHFYRRLSAIPEEAFV